MKNSLGLIVFLFLFQLGNAQGLLDVLTSQQIDTTAVTLSFKGTRIGLGHSIETRDRNTFELSIGQRYWNTPNEESSGFLVDQVCTTFALDYAFTDNLTVGSSISTLMTAANVFGKYRLRQQRNNDKLPLSFTFVQTVNYKSEFFDITTTRGSFGEKLAYTSQLLVAHKWNDKFTAQLSPTFIHRGSNRFEVDPTNQFAIGVSGRYKLSSHFELFSEYFYQINALESLETFDAFSLGANWEVSDLLLQFMLTNSRSYSEDLFITNNQLEFNVRNRNMTFGFRATYTFQL